MSPCEPVIARYSAAEPEESARGLRERHEARVEALQTRASDKALDCVGDGSFRIAKQTISLVREITPLVTPDLRAKVHYTGWLAPVPSDSAAPLIDDALIKKATSARPFDSSRGRQPFSFVVGHRQVIGGWDAAVAAMKVGERARILIAPEHGYGERGAGGAIPPDSWLLFDVEVLSAEADPEPAFSTPSLLALIPIIGILIYYLGFRDDIWEDMGGKAEL